MANRAAKIVAKQGYGTSEITRLQILDAAEGLFLEDGFDTISDRSILREAGQRNLSALKYHFGGRDGLILAIEERRARQVEDRRQKLLTATLARRKKLSVRDVFMIFVSTPVSLCQEDQSFRAFLARFGQRFIASNQSMLLVEQITSSVETMTQMIVDETEGMKSSLLLMRLENANALALIALTRMAQSSDSFSGEKAELFIENLLDQLEAMIIGPVSQKTSALLNNR